MDKERDCKECIVSTAKVGQASFSKLTADTAVNQVFTKPTLNGVAACHVAHEANKFQDKHAFCVSMSVQLQYSQKQLTVFFFFFCSRKVNTHTLSSFCSFQMHPLDAKVRLHAGQSCAGEAKSGSRKD